MKEETKIIYVVEEKIAETSDVWTLKLRPEKGSIPEYVAGQYITIYFPETGTPEGKAYSISSAPNEKTFDITVKKIGDFSSRLTTMKPGDKITGSLPYGYFYSESENSPLVLIAAGIGVAPFRSVITDALEKDSSRAINLFYSNRTIADIVFKDYLEKLSSKYQNFKIKHFITREKNIPDGVVGGRVDGKSIVKEIKSVRGSEFMVCGSISFTRDLWKSLKNAGVSEDYIYTEAFFSH